MQFVLCERRHEKRYRRRVVDPGGRVPHEARERGDRKSTRLNSSHTVISYAVFCLKKKKNPGWPRRVKSRSWHERAARRTTAACTRSSRTSTSEDGRATDPTRAAEPAGGGRGGRSV